MLPAGRSGGLMKQLMRGLIGVAAVAFLPLAALPAAAETLTIVVKNEGYFVTRARVSLVREQWTPWADITPLKSHSFTVPSRPVNTRVEIGVHNGSGWQSVCAVSRWRSGFTVTVKGTFGSPVCDPPL